MGVGGGGGRFDSLRSSLSAETGEVIGNPSEVFDSDPEKAQREHLQALERLRRQGRIEGRGRYAEMSVELEVGSTYFPSIQIAWPVNSSSAYLLRLDPITTGRGMESGIIAHTGVYGIATRGQEGWEMDSDNCTDLESLFGVPPGLRLAIKPTITRWAITKDELAEVLGKNTRTFYLGLGFLLLGHGWLHIGTHEAGHLPDTYNENEAWFKANALYAARHKRRKRSIINGQTQGLFDLLKKPNGWYSPKPTIGELVKYGLTSHYVGGQVHLPQAWKKSAETTLRTFRQIIEQAQEEFSRWVR